MDDAQRDCLERAALMAYAPAPEQDAVCVAREEDVAGLERIHEAARRKRERLAVDGEWEVE